MFFMKNSIFYLILILVLSSCQMEDQSYSYLSRDDAESAVVDFSINFTADNSDFYYLIQATELYVIWGNGDKPTEYIFPDPKKVDEILPIRYNYKAKGTFDTRIKALGLKYIDISKMSDIFISENVNNLITSLSLKDCNDLQTLLFANQPIDSVDLSECPNLKILSCGISSADQQITNLDYLTELQTLQVHGDIGQTNLDLSYNDSLRYVTIADARVSSISLEYLVALRSIEFKSLSSLSEIKLAKNNLLNQITLENNILMDASALDKLFEQLPEAKKTGSYIELKGNLGDVSCNRSIAIQKGWIFK